MASLFFLSSATHIISLPDHLFPIKRWPWKSKKKEVTNIKKNQRGFLASRIKNCAYNNPLQSWWYNLWSDLDWHWSACCHGATVAETTWGLAFCSQHLLVWHRLTGRTKRTFMQTFNTLLRTHWHGGPGEFMRSLGKSGGVGSPVSIDLFKTLSLDFWLSWFNSKFRVTGCNWDLAFWMSVCETKQHHFCSSLLFVRSHQNIRISRAGQPQVHTANASVSESGPG